MTDHRRWRLSKLVALVLMSLCVAGCGGDVLGLMPEPASAEALEIDHLTYMILYVTGATFFGVQGLLVFFLIKYRRKEGVPAKYTHGNHAVELTWTVLPALILVLLAVYQADLWVRVKSKVPDDNANAVKIHIFAKQFEWYFRYPGADGEFRTADDIATLKELVVPVDRPVNAEMRSMDVLHSFFLPNLRFKQDAVPGLKTDIWFRATKKSADRLPVANRDGEEQQLDYWDIMCAELCGNAHATMAAKLYVVSNDDYEKWLAGEETSVPLPQQFKVDLGKEVRFQSTLEKVWTRWGWQDDGSIKGEPRWKKSPFGTDKGIDADTGDGDGDDDGDF